jgi:hypothetical protein
MAANPKTQLLKLGIGTATVVATVGLTGWLWQAQQASAAEGQAVGGQAVPQLQVQPQVQPQTQQPKGGETHVEPRNQQQQRRTRTKHS